MEYNKWGGVQTPAIFSIAITNDCPGKSKHSEFTRWQPSKKLKKSKA